MFWATVFGAGLVFVLGYGLVPANHYPGRDPVGLRALRLQRKNKPETLARKVLSESKSLRGLTRLRLPLEVPVLRIQYC